MRYQSWRGSLLLLSGSIALSSACGDPGRSEGGSGADEIDADAEATLEGTEQADQDGSGDQTDQTDQTDQDTSTDQTDQDTSTDQTDQTDQDDLTDEDSSDDATTGMKFDMNPVPDEEDPPIVDECKVSDDMNAIGVCDESAPPDAFEPAIQWTFTDPTEPYSYVTPLVANFTDDDRNGEIDLCDVPDVVLVAGTNPGFPGSIGHIFLLSGDTGLLHQRFETPVDATFTPAIGDIDGDGMVEIVTASPQGPLLAFEHDGALKWSKPVVWDIGEVFGQDLRYSNSAALADLDNDGDVEIVSANMIFDHEGNMVHKLAKIAGQWGATTMADLDGDDDLEIVLGNAAFHHDGSPMWITGLAAGYPQVADLDDDGLPEILLTNINGLSLIEHDGVITYLNLKPTGVPAGGTNWLRPATIHDFDGDGSPEYATSSASQYSVYEANATILWTALVSDTSGIAAGTAFDFLGAGEAQAMYADEQHMFVFDGDGQVLLQISRKSGTLSEFPVVADIDNDGSAEILVVSNAHLGGGDPCIQAIRDIEDRWIQARRIWNQHSYHVSNVREDGTIPQFEPKSWEGLNTFRTNAQIEGGGLCEPDPQ